jgi:hypothetical protein
MSMPNGMDGSRLVMIVIALVNSSSLVPGQKTPQVAAVPS